VHLLGVRLIEVCVYNIFNCLESENFENISKFLPFLPSGIVLEYALRKWRHLQQPANGYTCTCPAGILVDTTAK